MKAAGRKREVRVVACRCLNVCPKHGATVVLATSTAPARCVVIGDAADGAKALAELLNDDARCPAAD